ncbi:hypothetical protein Bbelb_048290 [Branchiostoma belcheri]|nr:hypothetical protein Bbelb_048290 [Branchiostoma belcheri]
MFRLTNLSSVNAENQERMFSKLKGIYATSSRRPGEHRAGVQPQAGSEVPDGKEQLKAKADDVQREKMAQKTISSNARERVREAVEKEGCHVNESQHAFLQSILKSADQNTQFQENTAQQFLYQQQLQQSQHHDARTMWWHPLMRKWPKSNEIKFKFKYTRGGGEEVRLPEVAGVPGVQEPGDHHEAERVQRQREARGSKKAMDRISVLFAVT